jgi:hypothetical protein
MPPSTVGASRLRLQLSESKITNIGVQLIYGVGMFVWLIITMVLELWPKSSKTSRLILVIPVILCIGNIITPIPGSDVILDPSVEQSSLLTFILIGSSIISPWLSSLADRKKPYHLRIIKAFVVMLILLTLTQYGFFALRFVSDFETHFDTLINAMALALLGYAVSEFLHSEYGNKSSMSGVTREELMKTAQRTVLATGAQINVLNPV